MPRVNLISLEQRHEGIWIAGPREKTPTTHLRRGRGLHAINERELRVRNGTVTDVAIAQAHSLTRFNDIRFQAAFAVLYRNAVSISTGLDGTPLTFVSSEPRAGTDAEYLFHAGGGRLEKVDTSGAVTGWGIAPPDSGPFGTSVGGNGELVDAAAAQVFDPQELVIVATSTTANWSSATGSPLSLITDAQSPTGNAICAIENATDDSEESDEN